MIGEDSSGADIPRPWRKARINRGLDKYHEEPLQSVPLKYSITVGTVPVWKVKSVAGYKRGKYLKVMQEQQLHQHQHRALQEKEATAMAGGSSSDGAAAAAAMVVAAASSSSSSGRGASTSTRTRSNDVAAAVANTAAGGDGAASAVSTGNGGMHQQPTETPVPPEGFDRGAGGLPDPMLGLSIANKSMLHSLSGEELRAEMAKMNFNCGLIKKELCSLEKFRAGLVWMMDKSAMYQVQRHHNGDGIKAGAYGQHKKLYQADEEEGKGKGSGGGGNEGSNKRRKGGEDKEGRERPAKLGRHSIG